MANLLDSYPSPGRNNQSSIINGVSRRHFLKFCAAITASLGLPLSTTQLLAQTIEKTRRTPVIWLHFQECTGCTESLLRATHPTIEHLILDLISLDYNETLNTGSGHQAEKALYQSIEENTGKFILIVEGSIPVKENGIYCKIGDRTALDILRDIGPKAAAVVAIGSCASWGGVQSAEPNPTGATPVNKILTIPVINLPGCPASPYNLLSTVLYYLTLKKLPKLDDFGRPVFAYGRLIHEHCERRPHFDSGRFANEYGDDGHRRGWCLYKIGCKGPETFGNCSTQRFGDVGNATWPVGTGHPCYGCTEEGVGFNKPLHQQASVFPFTPPASYPNINDDKGSGVSVGAAALVGAMAGGAIGAGVKISHSLKKADEETATEQNKENNQEAL
ncbi:MAG: twin-arginine translocation signal domain-containing protein [Calditrichaeota bacterium]|nr:MAG: hydrogenase 2 small subunit [Calditrichota bacterium]MBL1206887.1 twin-arginine translocation signal domain-containing protein [Calditrichota bacterium]NOG46713.1 hydrogenase small subunit [Calditrichota bacterium]